MQYNMESVNALKLIISSLKYKNLSVKNTMEKVLSYLCEYYSITQEKKYLEVALYHIRAYLELGFLYCELEESFDVILELSNEEKNCFLSMITRNELNSKNISKSDIKSMIRRWSSSKYHTKSINDVVDDVLDKLKQKKHGIYYYHSNENPNNLQYDDVYELVIGEYESYFHDVRRNIYYNLRTNK